MRFNMTVQWMQNQKYPIQWSLVQAVTLRRLIVLTTLWTLSVFCSPENLTNKKGIIILTIAPSPWQTNNGQGKDWSQIALHSINFSMWVFHIDIQTVFICLSWLYSAEKRGGSLSLKGFDFIAYLYYPRVP